MHVPHLALLQVNAYFCRTDTNNSVAYNNISRGNYDTVRITGPNAYDRTDGWGGVTRAMELGRPRLRSPSSDCLAELDEFFITVLTEPLDAVLLSM